MGCLGIGHEDCRNYLQGYDPRMLFGMGSKKLHSLHKSPRWQVTDSSLKQILYITEAKQKIF
jgi:hypothetical protein